MTVDDRIPRERPFVELSNKAAAVVDRGLLQPFAVFVELSNKGRLQRAIGRLAS